MATAAVMLGAEVTQLAMPEQLSGPYIVPASAGPESAGPESAGPLSGVPLSGVPFGPLSGVPLGPLSGVPLGPLSGEEEEAPQATVQQRVATRAQRIPDMSNSL
jgi:hypothetical protein